MQAVNESCYQGDDSVLKSLVEIADTAPKYLRPHLEATLQLSLKVSSFIYRSRGQVMFRRDVRQFSEGPGDPELNLAWGCFPRPPHSHLSDLTNFISTVSPVEGLESPLPPLTPTQSKYFSLSGLTFLAVILITC